MDKIENLEKYIAACDEKRIGENEKVNFIDEIVGVYDHEIPNIRSGLDSFYFYGEETLPDYDGDIKKIKAKLINYKGNLELEEQKRKDELEFARLSQREISVSANANNENTIKISIILDQALESIKKLPDDILSKAEKEDIEDKLCGIEASAKRDKDKAKEKIISVVKFVVDKGADALISILPYLGQMAGTIEKS